MTTRSILLSAGAATLLAAAPVQAQGTDAYTGSVFATAASYCPANTVETQGQLLSINTYQALYSLLGTVFGGDARTNFGIPDLRGRSPVSQGQGPGLTYIQMGARAGQETVTLGLAQLPNHTHTATANGSGTGTVTIQASTAGPSTGNPAGNHFATFPGATPIYATTATTTVGMAQQTVNMSLDGNVTVNPTGGSGAFSVRSPIQALRFCVVVNGIYPPRP